MSVVAEENDTEQQEEIVEQQAEAKGETPEAENEQQGNESSSTGAEPEGELVVSIGDESPSSEEDEQRQAPEWVRELRKENRDKAREIRELKEQLAKREGAGQSPEKLSKPTLAECDYDEEVYEQRYEAWQKQERERQAEAERQASEQAAAENAWKERLTAYESGKGQLKLSDFDEAEHAVRETFNQTQMGIIVHGAKNSALVTYAIGKSPAKLKELASIKDPIKFAFAVAELETQVKTTTRKAAPPPAESAVRGNTPASMSADTELARLEAEADKTGDRTKVAAYRRKLMAKQN